MTPRSASPRLRPRWFLPRLLAGIAGLLLIAIVAFLLVFDWNWLRPMVERQASEALGRPVTIGSFDVSLRRASWIEMHDIAVANAEGFEGENLATAERIAIQVETFPLLVGRVEVPEIAVLRPRGRIETLADGRNNYTFDLGDDEADDDGGLGVEIGHLTIDEGDIRYIDARKNTDLRLRLQTDRPEDAQEPLVMVEGEGRYNGEPSKLRLRGGALLAFRDPNLSYPLDLVAEIGPNRARINGTIERPLEFAGARLALDIAGDDMSELYPLIGLPIPATPPYTLKGDLDFAGDSIVFRNFSGTVGHSDLAGDFAVDLGGERPRMTGDLVSRKVVLADLAGFIGAPPGGEEAAATQQAAPSGRLLPTDPISLDKLREFDVEVHYRGQRIESDYTPLDDLAANLRIDDGYLTLRPLTFGVGEGAINMNIALDGRRNPAATDLTVEFDKLDLKRIMQETQLFDGIGGIAGRAALKTTGNSLSDMMARGDGELQLFMAGGRFSKLLLELIGLDVTEALGFAMTRDDQQADLRCFVADMRLQQGIMEPRVLLLDTTDTNINVTGGIDFRDETLDLRIVPAPKDVSILTLRGPILVSGPMTDPNVLPETGNLAGRGAAAAVLGVLLTPLAALIPTIELGLGEDSDCQGLVNAVRQTAADGKAATDRKPAQQPPPPRPPAPAP